MDATTVVEKVTGIIEMMDNFEEMELEEQKCYIKVHCKGDCIY
jgi:hypothetical protein